LTPAERKGGSLKGRRAEGENGVGVGKSKAALGMSADHVVGDVVLVDLIKVVIEAELIVSGKWACDETSCARLPEQLGGSSSRCRVPDVLRRAGRIAEDNISSQTNQVGEGDVEANTRLGGVCDRVSEDVEDVEIRAVVVEEDVSRARCQCLERIRSVCTIVQEVVVLANCFSATNGPHSLHILVAVPSNNGAVCLVGPGSLEDGDGDFSLGDGSLGVNDAESNGVRTNGESRSAERSNSAESSVKTGSPRVGIRGNSRGRGSDGRSEGDRIGKFKTIVTGRSGDADEKADITTDGGGKSWVTNTLGIVPRERVEDDSVVLLVVSDVTSTGIIPDPILWD